VRPWKFQMLNFDPCSPHVLSIIDAVVMQAVFAAGDYECWCVRGGEPAEGALASCEWRASPVVTNIYSGAVPGCGASMDPLLVSCTGVQIG